MQETPQVVSDLILHTVDEDLVLTVAVPVPPCVGDGGEMRCLFKRERVNITGDDGPLQLSMYLKKTNMG